MKFPFDELNMRDPEHVDWVKSRRDPELWHAAAIAVLNYLGDPRGFLVWLMDQPETDRATAGYIFFGAYGSDYLRGQTDFSAKDCPARSGCTPCRPFAAGRRALASPMIRWVFTPGLKPQRQACLDLVDRGQIADGIVIPRALLDAALSRRSRSFDITSKTERCWIMTRDHSYFESQLTKRHGRPSSSLLGGPERTHLRRCAHTWPGKPTIVRHPVAKRPLMAPLCVKTQPGTEF